MSLENNLNILQDFVDELQATSSSNNKKEIIKKYSDNYFITKVLRYTFDSFKKYNVTSPALKKRKDLCENPGYYDLFYLLDALDKRTITGHTALSAVNGFIDPLVDTHKELIYNIIDGSIKGRISTTLVNKVIPDLIPTFDVALADKYDPKRVDFENEIWFASRKLDGVRCIIIVDGEGKATSWSRQGKQFNTLGKVEKEIEKIHDRNVVFDGELCLMNEDGSDDFQGVMKQIRKKDHTIENPKFKIFDMVSTEEFNKKESYTKLLLRLDMLKSSIEDRDISSQIIEILQQEEVTSEEVFNKWSKLASDNNWEGFMLRKNAPYKGKRSKDLLKVKTMQDAEYEVIDVAFAPFQHIKDGKEVESVVLSAVSVKHKENIVNVGSGFSFDQREYYKENPNEIIGKTITVQYFEESQNQNGEFSLRFPVVKCIYENGRDV